MLGVGSQYTILIRINLTQVRGLKTNHNNLRIIRSGLDIEYDSVHIKGTTLTIKGITALGEVMSNTGTVSLIVYILQNKHSFTK